MKYLIFSIIFITGVWAKVTVVTSYPYISDIVTTIGGELVTSRALAKGYNDPHFIVPKPSHIGKIKQADLLIVNGGELEIGWLPPLVDRANNDNLVRLDLSSLITFIEVPQTLSRDQGDIHAKGNPHFHLDPYNIPLLADAMAKALVALDRSNKAIYEKNLHDFTKRWEGKLKQWEKELAPLKGARVISYHKLFSYFFKRFGINSVIEIEALPGITPSSQHLFSVIQTGKQQAVRAVISDCYHAVKIPDYIASKIGTKMIRLPHDLGALEDIQSIEGLFDTMVKALTDD